MKAANPILCMGRNRRNQELLSQILIKAGYSVEVVLSYDDLIPTVEQRPIALVLLDITGFDSKIWQHYQALRSYAVPTFIIAPPKSSHLQARHGINAPFLIKPLTVRHLLVLISHTLQACHG